MKCKVVRENLSLYIDEKCEVGVRESIRKHLEKCKDCFEELSKLKHLVSVLKELPYEEIPEEFYIDLDKKIEYADTPLWKKVYLIFNLKTALVMLTGILIGMIIGVGIVNVFFKDSKQFIGGRNYNHVVVKTPDLAMASDKIDELRKKYKTESEQFTAAKIIPKRYTIVINGNDYENFVKELNKVGFLNDKIMVLKQQKYPKPITIDLELEEIKEGE
jgi:integrase